MLQIQRILLLLAGANLFIHHINAWVLWENNNIRFCFGSQLKIEDCALSGGEEGQLLFNSITVFTSGDTQAIEAEKKEGKCSSLRDCHRTIHSVADTGISPEYRHLYKWVISRCQGKPRCTFNGTLPDWWELIDDNNSDCGTKGVQYFTSILLDVECRMNEPALETVPTPPATEARTRPTTPTTTTPFPVFIPIYQPDLEGREKVILGVAIGLSLAILLVLLIVLYCCENYRNHKRFGKLLRKLGAPQAQEDAFDELEYGRQDAWKDETQNLDALGEYTGVKPDEFLTLDKNAMVQSGQIMYDTATRTMGKGNSCSTLDRLDRKGSPSAQLLTNYNYQGPTDYNTEENMELERRMAATLNVELEEETSSH